MSSPKRTTSSESRIAASRSIGLDGWYVFDGKSIQGPVTDLDLAELDADPVKRRRIQVSREGFQRWYSLEEISRLISLDQARSSPQIADEVQEFRRSYQQKMSHLQTLERSFGIEERLQSDSNEPGSYRLFDLNDAENDAAVLLSSSKELSSTHLPKDSFETLLAEATMKGLTESDAFVSEETPAHLVDEGSDMDAQLPEQAHARESEVTAESVFQNIENFQTDYVVLKGRLRLGQNRGVFSAALVNPLISLGLSIWNWYRSVAMECSYHLTSNFQRLVPPYFLVLIPGFSALMFYRVAVLVEEMERQNNYSTTSPLLAGVLGLFPPFGILYLQPRINRHWDLHIKSVQTTRGRADER